MALVNPLHFAGFKRLDKKVSAFREKMRHEWHRIYIENMRQLNVGEDAGGSKDVEADEEAKGDVKAAATTSDAISHKTSSSVRIESPQQVPTQPPRQCFCVCF